VEQNGKLGDANYGTLWCSNST